RIARTRNVPSTVLAHGRHCDREARPKREAIQCGLLRRVPPSGLLRRRAPSRNDGAGWSAPGASFLLLRPRASFSLLRPRAPLLCVSGTAGAATSGLRVEAPEDREDAWGHSCFCVLSGALRL